MFGLNSKTKKVAASATSGSVKEDALVACVIAKGTIIEGSFSASEDVRIDGIIKGDVNCERKIVMGESGKIEGKVFAGESFIKGRIEGELSVEGTLHLYETAFVGGKIKAKKLMVDEGASYNGECIIGGE